MSSRRKHSILLSTKSSCLEHEEDFQVNSSKFSIVPHRYAHHCVHRLGMETRLGQKTLKTNNLCFIPLWFFMFVFSNAQNLTNRAFHHHLCSFGLLGITFVQVELHLNALCVSLPVDAVLWRITKAPAAASGCWDRKQRDKVSLGTLGILPPGDRYCETLCGTTPLICTVCKRMNTFQTSAWFFLLQNTRWDNLQPRQSCLYKSTAASSGSCHLVAKLVRYPPCPDWAWPILDTQHSFSWIVCIEIFFNFISFCIILYHTTVY